MAQPGFIFGEGTADTYESLQAKRKTAERLGLAAMRTPQNLGEGLSSLGQAIAYRRLMGQADRGDAAGKAAYDEKRQSILGMLMGNQMGGGSSSAPSGPATPSAFATPNPAGLPPEIINAVDRVDSPIPEQFGKIESTYGLPAGYLDRTYMIESGGNPNAKNPNSSAEGPFQFIDSTAKQYGLTDKTDLAASADAAARFAADNAKILREGLGREPTASELYLAHQQGAGGALKLLTNPNAPASSLVGGDAVTLNGGDPSMTGGTFASLWTNKFGGSSGGSPMSTPGAAIPGITELMSDPYATEADKTVLGMLLQQQMEAMQPADPMQALDMEYKRAQIDQMKNPEANVPEGWLSKHTTALSGGLVPGTPEYEQFMLGSDSTEYGLTAVWGRDENGNPVPAQLSKNGTIKTVDLPPGWTPDPGLTAQMQAEGKVIGDATGQAKIGLDGALLKTKQALDLIDAISTDPALESVTGTFQGGLFAPGIPMITGGQAGTDLVAKTEQLKGKVFVEAFESLKGAGQITETEGAAATAAIGRLNRAQSTPAYQAALAELKTALQDLSKIAQARAGVTAPSSAPQATHRFNPATGKIEAVQ